MYAPAPPARAAVGGVLDQRQGSDTVGLLAAAGEGAEHLVDSVAWGAACAGPLRLRLAAGGQMCAAMSACGESLPVASGTWPRCQRNHDPQEKI